MLLGNRYLAVQYTFTVFSSLLLLNSPAHCPCVVVSMVSLRVPFGPLYLHDLTNSWGAFWQLYVTNNCFWSHNQNGNRANNSVGRTMQNQRPTTETVFGWGWGRQNALMNGGRYARCGCAASTCCSMHGGRMHCNGWLFRLARYSKAKASGLS